MHYIDQYAVQEIECYISIRRDIKLRLSCFFVYLSPNGPPERMGEGGDDRVKIQNRNLDSVHLGDGSTRQNEKKILKLLVSLSKINKQINILIKIKNGACKKKTVKSPMWMVSGEVRYEGRCRSLRLRQPFVMGLRNQKLRHLVKEYITLYLEKKNPGHVQETAMYISVNTNYVHLSVTVSWPFTFF